MPRFIDVVETAPDGLPERLRVCVVEDWSTRDGLDGQVEAFRLFLAARRVWCEQQGVARRDLPAAGPPRWRDGRTWL